MYCLRNISVVAFVGFAMASCAATSMYGAGFKTGEAWLSYSYDGGFATAPESGYAYCREGWVNYPNQWTTTPTINWQRTVSGNSGNTSSAQFGLGGMVTNTSASAHVAPNTFLSQYAPAGGNDSAVLSISEEVFAWSASSNPGSMTNIVGSYNLPLWANIPISGSIECSSTAVYAGFATSAESYGVQTIFSKTISDTWVWNTQGLGEHTVHGEIALPDLVPTMDSYGNNYYYVDMGFELTFKVKNDGGQVDFSMPEGLQFGTQGVAHAAVPEPGAFALLATGFVGLLTCVWRKWE